MRPTCCPLLSSASSRLNLTTSHSISQHLARTFDSGSIRFVRAASIDLSRHLSVSGCAKQRGPVPSCTIHGCIGLVTAVTTVTTLLTSSYGYPHQNGIRTFFMPESKHFFSRHFEQNFLVILST